MVDRPTREDPTAYRRYIDERVAVAQRKVEESRQAGDEQAAVRWASIRDRLLDRRLDAG